MKTKLIATMAILSGLMLLAGCDMPINLCEVICNVIPDFLGADCATYCGGEVLPTP